MDKELELVLLKTESQKDGDHYRVMTRKEAEELIRRNYEWRGQFDIICDVTKAVSEHTSSRVKKLGEEVERLKGLIHESFILLNREWNKTPQQIKGDWMKFKTENNI